MGDGFHIFTFLFLTILRLIDVCLFRSLFIVQRIGSQRRDEVACDELTDFPTFRLTLQRLYTFIYTNYLNLKST